MRKIIVESERLVREVWHDNEEEEEEADRRTKVVLNWWEFDFF